jgi:hypothetical protein
VTENFILVMFFGFQIMFHPANDLKRKRKEKKKKKKKEHEKMKRE